MLFVGLGTNTHMVGLSKGEVEKDIRDPGFINKSTNDL